MDLLTAIDSRASALKLTLPAPSTEQLQRIIDAGCRAPDHGRLSPWRIAVVGANAREQLGASIAAAFLAANPQADADQLERERSKATRAPAMIAVAAHYSDHPKVPQVEQLVAVAAAVENMVLAAHALGIGVMWKTGGSAYSPEVNALLGFEPQDQIVALLHLGTTQLAGKPRAAVSKVPVRWLD